MSHPGDGLAWSVMLGSGHASPIITITVYQHVHPGMGRQAAERFAALLEG